MIRPIIIAAALATLATPAFALDYDVSPYTGAIYPRSSSQRYDPPPVYVPPRYARPRTCPLDGPGAWECKRPRERRDR